MKKTVISTVILLLSIGMFAQVKTAGLTNKSTHTDSLNSMWTANKASTINPRPTLITFDFSDTTTIPFSKFFTYSPSNGNPSINYYTCSWDSIEGALKVSFDCTNVSPSNYSAYLSYNWIEKINKSGLTFNPFINPEDSIKGVLLDMSKNNARTMKVTYKVTNLIDSASMQFNINDANGRDANLNYAYRTIKPTNNNSYTDQTYNWNSNKITVYEWNQDDNSLSDSYQSKFYGIDNRANYSGNQQEGKILPNELPSLGNYGQDYIKLDTTAICLWTLRFNFGSIAYNVVDKTFEIYIKKIMIGDQLASNTPNEYIFGGKYPGKQGVVNISDSVFNLSAKHNSSDSVKITSTTTWSAISNKQWLKCNITSGKGNNYLTFTADANIGNTRTANISIISIYGTQTITVTQNSIKDADTLSISAGELYNSIKNKQYKDFTNLVLMGTIDIRDFKIIRDSLSSLIKLDLSSANIISYNDNQDSSESNEIPNKAFYNDSVLVSVILPTSITKIKNAAFYNCSSLISVTIPSSLTLIGDSAFENCRKLETISILTDSVNILKASSNNSSLTTIGSYAFANCISLSSITIPASVSSIGNKAFENCLGLNYIKINSFPKDITLLPDAFIGIDKTVCKLYIPANSKTEFETANYWNEFKNMIEYSSDTKINLTKAETGFIYPNPTTLCFMVNTNENALVKIYSINGKLISTKEIMVNEPIYINNIPKGIYIIKIITKTDVKSQSLIID
jgi:hypothetical protein